MGNYFTSNKVNANQHLINTDNKITILVDKNSIDTPVSQTDNTNIVAGQADANNVKEPEKVGGGESSEVVQADERTNSGDIEVGGGESSEVVEPDERTNSGDIEVGGDVEQQGGDSETSVENTPRVNKPRNRRKNKRPNN